MDAKIIAAVELLNAAAKEKKEDMQDFISDKYSHLKKALVDWPDGLRQEKPLVGGRRAGPGSPDRGRHHLRRPSEEFPPGGGGSGRGPGVSGNRGLNGNPASRNRAFTGRQDLSSKAGMLPAAKDRCRAVR